MLKVVHTTLCLLLVAGLAVPQATGGTCACESHAGEDAPPACCKSAAEPTGGCCSAPSNAESCCAVPGPCDCEGCPGARPVDPLAAGAGVITPTDDGDLPPTPLAPLAGADAIEGLSKWRARISAAPPPDLHALLCVWTL